MKTSILALASSLLSIQAATIPQFQAISNSTLLTVHNITRFANLKFENLAIRENGQILTTTAYPGPDLFQVDPLGILPPTHLYRFNASGANGLAGIAEGKTSDIFYVASGNNSFKDLSLRYPETYAIYEIDLRDVFVQPNGSLSRQPAARFVAGLPHASFLNGIAFARPHSDHLLVADTVAGLIWNVNTCDGTVGITLNDTTTKGSTPPGTGPTASGANGIKVHDGYLYYTSTGASKFYKVAINKQGYVRKGEQPKLIAENISCDDLVIDHQGNAYVAGTLNIVTKVTPHGKGEIIAGTKGSNSSSLVGPTALRFGRLASDRWSLYVTTNGGTQGIILGSTGISRLDLKSD